MKDATIADSLQSQEEAKTALPRHNSSVLRVCIIQKKQLL